MGVPRAVSFYGLLSGPPSDPPVIFSTKSNFPHWVSTPFLPYYRSQCTGTTAHMGQATPASRCEPTFRSSETPALPVPEQRPCECRATSVRSGTALKMSITPITNHQSPITKPNQNQTGQQKQCTHVTICSCAFAQWSGRHRRKGTPIRQTPDGTRPKK